MPLPPPPPPPPLSAQAQSLIQTPSPAITTATQPHTTRRLLASRVHYHAQLFSLPPPPPVAALPPLTIPPIPRFVKQDIPTDTKWLCLKRYEYMVGGTRKIWESCERITREAKSAQDGVMILARVKRGNDIFIPLVIQFRPPVNRCTLELPAGLVDPAESPTTTATRELYEETGLRGAVIAEETSPPLYLDPGLSGSAVSIVYVEVDGDLPENVNAQPHPPENEGEDIVVHLLPEREFTKAGLVAFARQHDLALDANLYCLA